MKKRALVIHADDNVANLIGAASKGDQIECVTEGQRRSTVITYTTPYRLTTSSHSPASRASGLAHNRCVGWVADRIIEAGGRAIVTETTEMMGCEDLIKVKAVDRLFDLASGENRR